MSKGNIKLQLATLKKEYLQKILYPQVIIVDSPRNEKHSEYSNPVNLLDNGVDEFHTLKQGSLC